MLLKICLLFSEERKSPAQRAIYEYLRGKVLDVFPEYKKEAEDHLSKAVSMIELFVVLFDFVFSTYACVIYLILIVLSFMVQVKLNPSLADAWLCLGNCIWKKGDLSAAKNCLNLALNKVKMDCGLP